MKIISILISLFILLPSASHDHDQRWGQIGHYVTGEIADLHLTEEAKTHVYELLGNRSMALATVWMDDIRSDSSYDYTSTWHWVTIPDNTTYAEAEKNPDGDVIWALETLISELKEGNLGEQEEAEKLKMVMHMIGDIHQPMHVGDGTDQGGNQVRLQWMGENSNLHRVWDSDIINSLQFSFTELASELNKATPEQVEEWQQSSVRDWAYESVTYRDQMYDLPDNMRIGYEYRYNNKKIVFHRLLQAGIRIAGVLNDIYGEESAR
jgi:hypothetical protein